MSGWKDTWNDILGALFILAIAGGLIVSAKVFPVWREFVVMIVPWALAVAALFVGVLYFRSKILPQWQERAEERRSEEAQGQAMAGIQLQQAKTEEFARYTQLRSEIAATNEYELWRKKVLERYGGKCAVCRTTENIEVDHRFKSFHKILKENGIRSVMDAYECEELWDVNNASALCKKHHSQTKSYIAYSELLNAENA